MAIPLEKDTLLLTPEEPYMQKRSQTCGERGDGNVRDRFQLPSESR